MAMQGVDVDGWDRIAEGFDELVTPLTMGFGQQALARVELGVGTRFLDVAAGTGALAIPAAREGAEVLAVDYAPTMVARLAERARTAGLENLEARVMDGTALDLEDDLFDVAASQNGVSLFPDLAGGLAEMVRVTRPGGQVLLVSFGPLERTEFVAVFMQAVKAAAPELPVPTPDDQPIPFQVSDPAVMAQRLREAGLVDVSVEQVSGEHPFESAEHYWRVLVSSNPIATTVDGKLTPDQRAQAKKQVEQLLHERSGGGPGGTLTSVLNIGVGTKDGV